MVVGNTEFGIVAIGVGLGGDIGHRTPRSASYSFILGYGSVLTVLHAQRSPGSSLCPQRA